MSTETLHLAAIGAILAALSAAFAFAAGWLTPGGRPGPGAIVDSLQAHDGLHSGFQRAHAKGLCIEGTFTANGQGAVLSTAAVFAPGANRVIGRFSTGGGDPYAPDGRLTFHAVALSTRPPMASNGAWRWTTRRRSWSPRRRPFWTSSSRRRPTRRPASRTSSFANGTYYSINAFRFTDQAGAVRHVRWSFVPEAPFEALDKANLTRLPPNFLFDNIIARLNKAPLRWHVMVTVAEPGDPLDDATKI